MVGKWFVGIAAGSQQMTTGPYLVEIAPNRIRGGLSTFTGLWSGVCNIICSLLLQVCNERYPTFYLLPVYVLWGVAVLMLGSIIVLPESPWVYGRRGEKEQAFKAMKKLYGNIKDYDYEEEWNIICRTLEHERMKLEADGATSYGDLFAGPNRRRTLILVGFYFAQIWGGLSMISTYGTCKFSFLVQLEPRSQYSYGNRLLRHCRSFRPFLGQSHRQVSSVANSQIHHLELV